MSAFPVKSLTDGEASPFEEARRFQSPVMLRCCLPMDGGLKELALDGVLRSVDGREGRFEVRSVTPLSDRGRVDDDRCEFSFDLVRANGKGVLERMGFKGTALILNAAPARDGAALRTLDLRFPRTYVTHRLRKSRRYLWDAAYTRLLRVTLCVGMPQTREDLAELLRASAHSEAAQSHLIDVSAGGARACLHESIARPAFANARYLVFFLPHMAGATAPPYVFLAQRMGLGIESCRRGVPVRMRFLAEMDWSDHQHRLVWLDVRQEGSPRLAKCLSLYDDLVETGGGPSGAATPGRPEAAEGA